MKSLTGKILLTFGSSFIAFLVLGNFEHSLSNLILRYFENDYQTFRQYQFVFYLFPILSLLWLLSHLTIEILNHRKPDYRFDIFLKHFRNAPLAVLVSSILITFAFDFGMIEYSKWKIKNYVFDETKNLEIPHLALHNDYRGWCGNGYFANTSYLYYDTASEQLNNENPNIRARALLVTNEVADIFNGTDRQRFKIVLTAACKDSSETVRETAESVLTNSFLNSEKQNCQNFILEK